METFFTSFFVVAIAEIGDKTQLLTLALAARYRRPWPIGAGMLLAIALNHALAGGLGVWLANMISPEALRWVLAASFFAMAVWVMIPDRLGELKPTYAGGSIFLTAAIAFFLAEMGDKTQIATVALAARFGDPMPVILGTTAGLVAADGPILWLSSRLALDGKWLRLAHLFAAALFIALGLGAFLS